MGTRRQDRLLREAIREVLLEADPGPLTVGDVKKAIAVAQEKGVQKAKAEAGKMAKEKALTSFGKILGGFVPGVGSAVEFFEAGKDIYGILARMKDVDPKTKESHPLWDKLTIEPNTAAVLDSAVEDRFVKDLGAAVAGLPDNTPLPDADVQLTDWMKVNYGGTHVAKAGK